MADGMSFVLWTGDPLLGVVVWGSAGLVMWCVVAALVGSALGMLHSLDATPHRRPVTSRPRPGTRRPPLNPHAVPLEESAGVDRRLQSKRGLAYFGLRASA